MVAKIIQIGNSRGIRIPKPLIDQMGAPSEVELLFRDDELILRPVHRSRAVWALAFREMAGNNDDTLLDDDVTADDWDEHEWQW